MEFFFIDNNKLINTSHRDGSTLIQRKQEILHQLLAKILKLTNTNTNWT